MPELAEVEVVRRNLEQWWIGRQAVDVCLIDGELVDDDDGDALVDVLQRPLRSARRRGKYLSCHFDGQVLVFHFRMTGKIICADCPNPDYARCSWHIPQMGWLVFKDQRRLGSLRRMSSDKFHNYAPLEAMGPEPEDVTVEDIRGACTGRRLLKTALLDQSIVAGVGNIAISELFWRLELAPDIKCGQLTETDWRHLIRELPSYFDEIIEASMSDEIDYIEEGAGDSPFQIYGRGGRNCPRCGSDIQKTRVGGRSSYYCESCQSSTR